MTRWIIANFVAAGTLTCIAFAADAPPAQKQESAQQSPSRVEKQGRPDGQQRPRREWWRENGGKPPAMSSEPLTDEEYQRISQFMQTNSPHRWKMIEVMLPERRDKIIASIRQQYHWMERLKTEDPEIYAIRLKRLPIEDEMFHLGWDARHDDDKPASDTQSKLREQVRLFLDNCLAERKIRLERWKARLREGQQHIQREESFIAEAQANLEARIDQGVEFVKSEKIGKLKEWAGPMFNPRPLEFAPDRSPTTAPSDDR